MTHDYIKDGAEIYRQSFATIRREARLDQLPEDVAYVAVRMIHASGQVDLVDDIAYSPSVIQRARTALQAGAPILCDAQMVASGVTRTRLPADNEVLCLLNDPRVPGLAAIGYTKSGNIFLCTHIQRYNQLMQVIISCRSKGTARRENKYY